MQPLSNVTTQYEGIGYKNKKYKKNSTINNTIKDLKFQ